MLYCVSSAEYPAEYASCGNLISEGGFLHDRRTLDSWVLIVVCKGVLYITQNERNYEVKENESIVLFPGITHYGTRNCEGFLSYYWVHFYLTDPDYMIYNRKSLLRYNSYLYDNVSTPPPENSVLLSHNQFILPEYSRLSSEKRSALLFTQLLDISKRDNYMLTWRCRYALNMLLCEFTAEFLAANNLNSDKIPNSVKDILEWIRVHYEEPITVNSLAERFNYHPTYMTSIFKKYTGYTVSCYITQCRLTAAKNLLTATRTLSIRAITYMCGFRDEKYFMRVFKKTEGMTPSQFRNAFSEKKLNLR